ncbi:type VI secretion system amidase effector protein Tae4 [Teredinibacter sp. KSP-S5-2]|uniref:type VI secretion system amidase effector protein Tae4 n=1 Tax=Teredinibacter sp. KSP-S5-2 TaxID=3034506 RepID=UPI002934748E|nr:type VI secretion system amidase effector protein Tae4 [Teredinibacter sp. KSP-S5-2]WNO10655.1 type VI secretion system amidase effector protein Tae4 [Teredinibacter sp. KSP-S5-2]
MSKFEQMWNNFPKKEVIKVACTNKQKDSNKPFSDYCAIMLSECFIRSGISISAFKAKRCWSHKGEKHILLAEELANALNTSRPASFQPMKKISPSEFQSEISGKTGVIFFKDYWSRGKESFESRSGDHIDLWNKDKITSSGMVMRSIYEFFGVVSDLNKSKEVWFWEVK